MPYTRCPKCGNRTHVNIGGDPMEWFRRHHVEYGQEVPRLCHDCWRAEQGIEIPAEELERRKRLADGTWRQPAADTIPCPHCGKPLRTRFAKQCFQCGADWHGS